MLENKRPDGGLSMSLVFFIIGFVAFIVGIGLYLRSEDTQWHKTVTMIKTLTDMQITDKHSTDNTLQTVIRVVDTVRLDHAKEIVDLKLAHVREIDALKSQFTEVSAHLAHLRKENHQTQILLTNLTASKKSDDLAWAKDAAQKVIKNVRENTPPPLPKKVKKNKSIKVKASRNAH